MASLALVAAPVARAAASVRLKTIATPTPVIFDTDMYSDFDAGGAEVSLLVAALQGQDNVIAMGLNTRWNIPTVPTDSWKCVAAIAQYYGYPNIPIGSSLPDNGPDPTTNNFIGPCGSLAAKDTPAPQSAVEVYRKALVSQADDSVVFVETGYEENLKALLDSPADSISPLTGSQLIAQKVKELVVMGGGYPSDAGENNFTGDAGAASTVAASWPTQIVYSGYEIGENVFTGQNVTNDQPTTSPVYQGMLAFAGPHHVITSFDITASWYALNPGDASMTESAVGTNVVNDLTGANAFTPGTGDENYLLLNDATSLEASINTDWDTLPGTKPQGLAFSSTQPSAPVLGDSYQASVTPGATGNPVTLSIDTLSTSGCTIDSSGDVTFSAPAGTCIVDANEPGTLTYAAGAVQQTITVGLDPQAVSFTSTAPVSPAVGTTYQPSAVGGASGNPVTFSIDKASTSGCTIDHSGVVHFRGRGTCVIDANQAGTTTYAPAPQVQQTVGVAGTVQTVTFTSSAPAPAEVGGAAYTPTATASSGLVVSIALDHTSKGCTLAGGVVTFTAVGTCVIDASQAGSATYVPAAIQQVIAIGRGASVITVTSAAPVDPRAGESYRPAATSSSGDRVRITIGPSSTACSMHKGSVQLTAAGTCVVVFTDFGNHNWAAVAIHQVLHVTKGELKLMVTASPSVIHAGDVFVLRATASPKGATGTVTFSSGSAVLCTATLHRGSVSCHATAALARGSHAVTATYDGSAAYAATKAVVIIRVT